MLVTNEVSKVLNSNIMNDIKSRPISASSHNISNKVKYAPPKPVAEERNEEVSPARESSGSPRREKDSFKTSAEKLAQTRSSLYKNKTARASESTGEQFIGCLKAAVKQSSLARIKEEDKSQYTFYNEDQAKKGTKKEVGKGTVYERATAVACVKCPQCNRSFGLKAAEPHIKYCVEKARIMNSKHINTKMSPKKERPMVSEINPPPQSPLKKGSPVFARRKKTTGIVPYTANDSELYPLETPIH